MSMHSSEPNRRDFLATSATALLAASAGAGGLGLGSAQPAAAAEGNSIRPFTVSFPQEDVAELRRRVAATRWPDQETVADDTQGVQLATMQKLAQYWATDYDWSRCEAQLRPCRTSSPRSTASTSISSTSVRSTKTRCR